MKREAQNAPEIDQHLNTLWHYWAESPRPDDLWSAALSKLLHGNRNLRSHNNEHPWHRLVLRGRKKALLAWCDEFENPISTGILSPGDIGELILAAAWSGSNETLEWIISQTDEALIDSRDSSGMTPLMIAIHRCDRQAVNALLWKGANPELVDERGRSSVHHAAQHDDDDLFTLLETVGADADFADHQGQTARDILAKSNRTPQQSSIAKTHWERRYAQRALF